MEKAQRRLLLALAASALLHLWLAGAATEHGARRVSVAGGAPMRAALNTPPIDVTAAPQAAPRETSQPKYKASEGTVSTRDPARAPAPPNTNATDIETRAAVSRDGSAALTQPSDPTYYAARSLDVFPKAITALNLGTLPGAANVRAMVFIDESGTVTEVRAVQADRADIETATRELLMRTRFTPASKDGRLVKAQVMVSLE